MGGAAGRTSQLSIQTGLIDGRPVAIILIDGVDVLDLQRPSRNPSGREYPDGPKQFRPARPADLLPPDSAALLPTALPRHAMIGICGCGEPGCASMWVRVRRDGDEVVWEPDPDTPAFGHTVDTTWRFALRPYLDAVDDGQRSTVSWETRSLRLARELRRRRDSLDGFSVIDSVSRKVMRLLDVQAWPARDEVLISVIDHDDQRQLEVDVGDGDASTDEELIARLRSIDMVRNQLRRPARSFEQNGTRSVAAGAASRKSVSTVVMGHSGFPEQATLAELYAQALRSKGFEVRVRGNLASISVFSQALGAGMINMFPAYLGVICSDLPGPQNPPLSVRAAYEAASAWGASHDCALLEPSASQTVGCVVVRESFAREYGLITIDDLRGLDRFIYGGEPRFAEADGLRKHYDLTNLVFRELSADTRYTSLERHEVDGIAGVSTDGQLADADYAVLDDTSNIFGYNPIAPVVANSLLANASLEFASTLNAVTALLSTETLIALNKSTQLDGEDPGAVATAFLTSSGLLT